MKRYFIILVCAIFLIPFSGCKKNAFDPSSKSVGDFVGTWKGSISTFKNNKLLKEDGTMVIYPDAGDNNVSGILFMEETSVFHEFQFVDGTLYFKVDNNDPANPYCQNWTLSGFAVFATESEINIHISGNECGAHGDEFISWVGNMTPTVVSEDSLEYYNFAKSGNIWTYKLTLKNGDTCQVQKQVSQVSANYNFSGPISETCGWTAENMTFRWDVNPSGFSILHDSTLSNYPLNFAINSKLGVVYYSYINSDTITVSLLDSNVMITTPAGNYKCVRFRYTEPVYTDTIKVTKTAYVWLNVRYGIIRQETLNPADPTDIQLQELISKNF
ncbi:MAG: hypothetical protein NTW16_11895 [Bacteroidetes bacterium]|nr:hypothetical protein [Bacteroidota bacterium]